MDTNSSTSSGLQFQKYSIKSIDIVFAALYLLVQVIGITGNALVITVVRKTRTMYTTTNLLLVNLAVADILTLVTCPRNGYLLAITLDHPKGVGGDILCKFLTGNAIVGISMTVSSVTLTVLALERYRALLRPLNRHFVVSLENVHYVITGIWMMSLVVNIPDFIKNKYSDFYGKCVCPFSLEVVKDSTVHVACTVFFIGIVPFLILAYCYTQILRGIFFTKEICSQTMNQQDLDNKKRLARLLLSVTIAFYICYIPYGVYFVYLLIQERDFIISYYNTHYLLLKIFEFLLVCSCTLNPILYAFQSSNYRQGFKDACSCCCTRKKLTVRTSIALVSTRRIGCETGAEIVSFRRQTVKTVEEAKAGETKDKNAEVFSNL